MNFPYLGPNFLKLGLIDFISKSDFSSINSIFFTLTSLLISSETELIIFFLFKLSTGIKILFKGCLTLIFSFALKDNVREEIICA